MLDDSVPLKVLYTQISDIISRNTPFRLSPAVAARVPRVRYEGPAAPEAGGARRGLHQAYGGRVLL